jgi:hypothetical protein
VKSIRCDPDGEQTDAHLLACSRVGRVQHPVQSQTFHGTTRLAAEHSIDAFERDLAKQVAIESLPLCGWADNAVNPVSRLYVAEASLLGDH